MTYFLLFLFIITIPTVNFIVTRDNEKGLTVRERIQTEYLSIMLSVKNGDINNGMVKTAILIAILVLLQIILIPIFIKIGESSRREYVDSMLKLPNIYFAITKWVMFHVFLFTTTLLLLGVLVPYLHLLLVFSLSPILTFFSMLSSILITGVIFKCTNDY